MKVPDLSNLRAWYEEEHGLELQDGIESLRDQQMEAIEWAASRPEPYLLINAPTGAGKTLINTTLGCLLPGAWTYAVHTIRLQQQVADIFHNLPVFTGRGNHPCLIGEATHLQPDLTASEGICTTQQWCPHDGSSYEGHRRSDDTKQSYACSYMAQKNRALDMPYRIVNYALLLVYKPLLTYSKAYQRRQTETLLCDEAHNVEDAVCNSVGLFISERMLKRYGIQIPKHTTLSTWIAWAKSNFHKLPEEDKERPTIGLKNLRKNMELLAQLDDSQEGEWLVEFRPQGVELSPIWGAPHVTKQLMGHEPLPDNATLYEASEMRRKGVEQAVFTSATLMGAEFTAEMLGLPDGSWAYLDLPSTFAVSNRPINYAPVDRMNAKKVGLPEGRAKMQRAIDRLIELYVLMGRPTGLIHAVSNRYRDFILTDSKWRGIMTSDEKVHADAVAAGKAAVLVAANLMEGWDGADELCRFIILPKVPFPDLGDERTKVRKSEDGRTYDHRALVSVVQGVGRGFRHSADYCDAWILDGNWRFLHSRRQDWLPESFRSAYRHNVKFPWGDV